MIIVCRTRLFLFIKNQNRLYKRSLIKHNISRVEKKKKKKIPLFYILFSSWCETLPFSLFRLQNQLINKNQVKYSQSSVESSVGRSLGGDIYDAFDLLLKPSWQVTSLVPVLYLKTLAILNGWLLLCWFKKINTVKILFYQMSGWQV